MTRTQLLHEAKKVASIKKHLQGTTLLANQRSEVLMELFGILDNLILAVEKDLKE